ARVGEWARGTLEQTAISQPLKDPGHGTGMQPEDLGRVTRRDVWKLTDNAKDEALRSGDAQFTPHPLGHALEPMLDGPEQTHEVQNRIEAIVLGHGVAKRHERDDTPPCIGLAAHASGVLFRIRTRQYRVPTTDSCIPRDSFFSFILSSNYRHAFCMSFAPMSR